MNLSHIKFVSIGQTFFNSFPYYYNVLNIGYKKKIPNVLSSETTLKIIESSRIRDSQDDYNFIIQMILKTISNDGKQQKIERSQSANNDFTFIDDLGTCEYKNFASLQKNASDNFTPNQIKVSNKLCRLNGQFMEKVTIVKFNDEIITIKDRYRFFNELCPNADLSSQKRIHIFKKPLHAECKSEGKRRVTKNLPKNFIKAFLNYLESVKDEKNSELLECKMKLFTSRQKYNNSFIQGIIDDSDLEHYFIDFLNNHAKQWIQNSKIRDKEVHFEAIQVFKRLSASRSDKKEEVFAEFQSYLSSFSDQSQRISSNSRQEFERDKQSIIANSSKSSEENAQQ